MNKSIKPEKFIFETNFLKAEVKPRTPQEIAEDIENAKAESLLQGIEKGKQQAIEQFSTELETTLAPLKEKLNQFSTEKSELHKLIQEKALIVVNQVVQLLFKHLEKELNEETLASAISQTMDNLVKDVHIIIKVNQKAYDFLNTHNEIKSLLSNKDAELKVDTNLNSGECTMEWENAGARINLTDITKSLEKILQGLLPNNITTTQKPEEEKPTEKVAKTTDAVEAPIENS